MIYVIKQEGLYQNKVNSSLVFNGNCKWAIGLKAHVRYVKILTSLRGFRVKFFKTSQKRLEQKRTKPNIEKWPESLGVMLEF